jgi:hypothetical protein
MDNKELELLAKETIERVQPLFDKVMEVSTDLQNNTNLQDIDRYFLHEDVLTGLYGQLNIEYKKLYALKKNKEAEYYNHLKVQSDMNNTKFTSAVAEKESSFYIGPIREVRSIIEGYVEVIVKSIETCRSHIYSYEKDRKYDV